MTSGAKTPTSAAKAGDLVLAGIVRAVVDAVAGRGITRAEMLAKLGLGADELDDPDGLVPLEAYLRAWEVASAIPGNEDLGLTFGARTSLQALGALGYAMVHAESALAATRLFHRHRRLTSDALAPEIDIDREHVIYHLVWPARVARIAAFADMALMGPIRIMRELAGLPDSAPLAVEAWYQCARPAGADRAVALGCPVRFGAPEMKLVLRRELLEGALPRHDPALFEYLARHSRAVLARIPESTAMSERVRRLVTETLRSGEPAQADVSRKLAVSERTLQRRLREEGTSFAEILDAVRRELSQLYLQNHAVTLHEVAFLLGYSEPSAFHRAFRRWTGMTPQAFRRDHASEVTDDARYGA